MKWLKTNEVKESGWYLLGRTDDPCMNDARPQRIFGFKSYFILEVDGNSLMLLEHLDDEVRFLGPLPELEK